TARIRCSMPCSRPSGGGCWSRRSETARSLSTSACAARARRRSSATDAVAAPAGIRDLISYRLHVVANLLSRGAELRYRREFGVSLWEWRTVALLGDAEEPQSLNDLAHAAGIHKSQMSRVVSGLAARRLVVRSAHTAEGRGDVVALRT